MGGWFWRFVIIFICCIWTAAYTLRKTIAYHFRLYYWYVFRRANSFGYHVFAPFNTHSDWVECILYLCSTGSTFCWFVTVSYDVFQSHTSACSRDGTGISVGYEGLQDSCCYYCCSISIIIDTTHLP